MTTIKADRSEVCWQVIDLATGANYFADHEYQPHYPTRANAAEAIAELHRDRHPDEDPLHLVAKPCYGGPCVLLVCDGCGYVFDEEEYTTHFDPADPFPVPITDYDWTLEHRRGEPDRHYCPGDTCGADVCEDCNERHHGACLDPAWAPVSITDGQLALLGGDV